MTPDVTPSRGRDVMPSQASSSRERASRSPLSKNPLINGIDLAGGNPDLNDLLIEPPGVP